MFAENLGFTLPFTTMGSGWFIDIGDGCAFYVYGRLLNG